MTGKNFLHLIMPWKRKFDSPTQKSRGAFKNREKFSEFLAEFSKYMNPPNIDPAKALKVTDELIRMEPQRAVPWMLRCQALGVLGRFNEALTAIDHAIEIDPSDPEKWLLRATILRSMNRTAEATEAEKQAQRMR